MKFFALAMISILYIVFQHMNKNNYCHNFKTRLEKLSIYNVHVNG